MCFSWLWQRCWILTLGPFLLVKPRQNDFVGKRCDYWRGGKKSMVCWPKAFWKTSNPLSTNCQLVANVQLVWLGFSDFEFLIDSNVKKYKLLANSWQLFFFRKKHLRHIRLWLAWVFCWWPFVYSFSAQQLVFWELESISTIWSEGAEIEVQRFNRFILIVCFDEIFAFIYIMLPKIIKYEFNVIQMSLHFLISIIYLVRKEPEVDTPLNVLFLRAGVCCHVEN